MTTRLDWIKVGPRGIYALMDAQLARPREEAEFKAEAAAIGHTVELVTVAEACRRHREFLYGPASMHVWLPHPSDLPSFLPSPAQMDLFGEDWP